MRLKVIMIGKTDEDWVLKGVKKYSDRLKHYIKMEWVEIPDLKGISKLSIEEQKENGVESAVRTAVPNTGKAILGSSTTDGVGFLALLLASISFIRDLGITLALGEFLTVGAALILTPALMIEYRRWKGK